MGKEDFAKKMGARIKIIRISLGLSQKQLAEKIGAKQNEVSRWENGNVVPDAHKLFSFVKLLGISWEDIDIIKNSEVKFG